MANVRVELDRAGVRELLLSGEAQACVDSYAAARMARLSKGYAQESRKTDRSVATIHAATREARQDNLKNNTLARLV